jgi:hypothetical protein
MNMRERLQRGSNIYSAQRRQIKERTSKEFKKLTLGALQILERTCFDYVPQKLPTLNTKGLNSKYLTNVFQTNLPSQTKDPQPASVTPTEPRRHAKHSPTTLTQQNLD